MILQVRQCWEQLLHLCENILVGCTLAQDDNDVVVTRNGTQNLLALVRVDDGGDCAGIS